MARTSELHKKPLVFGLIDGKPVIINVPTAQDEQYRENSGRWATHVANQGRLTLGVSATTALVGWIMTAPLTASTTTDEASKVDLDIALDTIYEMPIDAAQTAAALMDLLWESCDLVCAGVTSVQYADLDGSSTDVIQIVDFRAYSVTSSANNTVVVRRNITGTTASVICAGGVA